MILFKFMIIFSFSVNWDKIPIYVFGTKVSPYKLVEAVNASIVALCEVEESLVSN